MRKNSPKECKDCGKPISQNRIGATRVRCEACVALERDRSNSLYYFKRRARDPVWREKNKVICKEWRVKNADRIVRYRAHKKRLAEMDEEISRWVGIGTF
jgi:hypothetical protein